MNVGFTLSDGTRVSLAEAAEIVTRDGWLDGQPYPIIMGIINTLEHERRPGIHATQLTSCARKVVLDATTPQWPSLARTYWLFRGLLLHSVLESNPEPGSLIEVTLSRTINGMEIVGTPDKVVPAREEISDWKTARRLKISNLPYGEHGRQINIYRWLAEPQWKISKMMITYMDMNSCVTVGIPVMKDTEKYILRHAEVITEAVERSVVPEGFTPAEVGERGWLCKYCDHTDLCRGD